MPTPAKFEEIISLSGKETQFQHNALGNLNTSVLNEDACDERGMPLAVVDEEKLPTKTVQPHEVLQGQLSTLISGWSSLSTTFYRRDSCEFTRCVSPCVRKATTHLQQLKDQLTKLSVINEESSLATQTTCTRTCCAESRSTITPESHPVSCGDMSCTSVRFSSLSDHLPNDDRHDSQLSIASLSMTDPNKTSCSLVKSRSSERRQSVCQNEGYIVVEEVIRLLGRMEEDRLSTQQILLHEKQRVNYLQSQIDHLAFKRLIDLPDAVQKEHESCSTDINELKWHCAYQGRLEARLKRKIDRAELQHSKIIGQLEASKESCPLVCEKLDLEDIAMTSIQSKQDENDDKLRQALKLLEATRDKTREAKTFAAQERMLIKQDVDITRNLLNEVSDELAQLKMNYTSNVHTISDIKNTLKENAEQCVNLEKREDRVKSQEASQHDKVGKLREKIVEQTSEHARLMEENEKLKSDKQIMEEDYQSSVTKLKIGIKQYEIQVRELSRKNKTMREDMDDTVKKTEKFKKQRMSEKKALVRYGQEAEKVKQHIEMMNEEVKKLRALNHSLKLAKTRTEEDYFSEEDSLKSAEQSLKNQLKEESHARTILQARIATDTSDLFRSRVDSKKKKEKMSQQALDADKVLTRIGKQVEKLEKVHCEREQTIAQISDVLDKLNKQRLEMELKYRAKISELRPKEDQNKQETLELHQKIDDIQWRSEMMTKKIKDMSSSTVMMNRVIKSTSENITELEEDSKEVKLRLEAMNDVEDSLKQALEAAKDRVSFNKEQHSSHVYNRRISLEHTSRSLDEKLEENKSLAQKYQALNNQYLQTKELFFRRYENLVNNESHLKDHKELHTLQARLHDCLQHYYSLRGLHNKYQVSQFKLTSKQNNDKLLQLKRELCDVINHINNFLYGSADSHQTISLEAYKLQQTRV